MFSDRYFPSRVRKSPGILTEETGTYVCRKLFFVEQNGIDIVYRKENAYNHSHGVEQERNTAEPVIQHYSYKEIGGQSRNHCGCHVVRRSVELLHQCEYEVYNGQTEYNTERCLKNGQDALMEEKFTVSFALYIIEQGTYDDVCENDDQNPEENDSACFHFGQGSHFVSRNCFINFTVFRHIHTCQAAGYPRKTAAPFKYAVNLC